MKPGYLVDLTGKPQARGVGQKAANLSFLMRHHFPTPVTWVCTWDAFSRYVNQDPHIAADLKAELSHKLDLQGRYAVRSSANIEDGAEYSLAGQFKSVLNVQGLDNLLTAIHETWASAHSREARAYLKQIARDARELKMAVIVQEMISPVASGVVFSRNPITGADEMLIEAVRGSGDSLVQDGVTPSRWIYRRGEWAARPENDDIGQEVIEQVVAQARGIAKAYGRPVDLEWVYDGQQVRWVQMREITSLKNAKQYSNQMAQEMLPGMIRPLSWSVNVPMMSSHWKRLLAEVVGPNRIDADSLVKAFYYRAYFNMSVLGDVFEAMGLPRDSLELMAGMKTRDAGMPAFRPTARTLRLIPRMIAFMADKWRFEQRLQHLLPEVAAQVAAFPKNDLDAMSDAEIMASFDLAYEMTACVSYHVLITQLLMSAYNGILRGHLKKRGLDADALDVTANTPELASYDPAPHLARLRDQFDALDRFTRERLLEGGCEAVRAEIYNLDPRIAGFCRAFVAFMDRFGFLGDNTNDITSRRWREQPDVALSMIARFTPRAASRKLAWGDLPLSALRRWMMGPLYRRARAFRLYREELGYYYAYSSGLIRCAALALGGRWAQRGWIAQPEDIFDLYRDEVHAVAAQGQPASGLAATIAARQREMCAYEGVALPTVIYGDQAIPLDDELADVLEGVATSQGYYRGPVCVVRGAEDFDKLRDGDVLVAPFSDVGWTPLFARAGAVVTESGGMLSHCSIVAREYGIPAVVSVAGACRLADGETVTVDAYKGRVLLHRAEQATQEEGLALEASA